jgi:hypothetical protein
MVLKPEMKGKRYRISMANNGPLVEELWQTNNTDDDPNLSIDERKAINAFLKDRIWAPALLIDGVNSFYQKTGDTNSVGQEIIGPVVRHPLAVSKWILTPSGKALQSAENNVVNLPSGYEHGEEDDDTDKGTAAKELKKEERFKNAKFVNGNGNSQIIPGFQKNLDFADAFVFTDANTSLAETVGITNDVGMIAIHFYGEKLPPGVVVRKAAFKGRAGTTTGSELPHKVFPVIIRLEENPEQVWRIFYRYEGDPGIPTDLVPVTD